MKVLHAGEAATAGGLAALQSLGPSTKTECHASAAAHHPINRRRTDGLNGHTARRASMTICVI
jgi:hypothetical protein